ncbi:MAG: sporulation peptidase YabG, partial [Halanaerobiales bacterium]
MTEVKKKSNNGVYRQKDITVLHIDGDREYLQMSMQIYGDLSLTARGHCIPEEKQPGEIGGYLKKYCPDFLVITGHDGFYQGEEYYTSNFFIEAVRVARSYQPDLDQLVIFAGACQSSYRQLINQGANFASSPEEILIHFMDPVLVVE